MQTKRIQLLIVFIGLMISSASFATVSGNMGDFFDKLGFDGNVTSTSAYQGQQAGYYSGGSLYLRKSVKNAQLVHLDIPSYRIGCGGIDLYKGGFSFINGKGLIDLGKSIMSGAATYFVELALQTVDPQIQAVKQQLQSVAQFANNANVNSCQLGQSIAGGLWPRLKATHDNICQMLGTEKNIFSDWAEARQKCGTGGDKPAMLDRASKNKDYQAITLINKNIIWDSLHRNGFLSGDSEFAEFLMSLSGTIIFDAKGKPTFLTALVEDNRNLIKTLLDGGTATLYHCDEEKLCLNPTQTSFTLLASKALRSQVKKIIESIMFKVKSDHALSDTENGFLSATTIPVLKFIMVAESTNHVMGLNQLDAESDLIAEDILKQYLMENLRTIERSLKQTDLSDRLFDEIIQQLREAMKAIKDMDQQQSNALQNTTSLMNTMKGVEKSEAAVLTNTLSPNTKEEMNR